MSDTLYIVVPCFNEEDVLTETGNHLGQKLDNLIKANTVNEKSRILFVNDGSHDTTWEIIKQLSSKNHLFSGISLSINRGHQNALLAGLEYAKDRADVTISIDADLQDDTNAIDLMLEKYYSGCDIVYGVRSNRKKDSFFKRKTAEFFYRIMNFLGAKTIYNHADYRLMSKRAVSGLLQFEEVNLFLRGIVPMIGFKSDTVYYERGKRFAGKSKYPLKKMISFALEGITSCSSKPIKLITLMGFLIFLVSIAMICYFIFRWSIGKTVSGWASVICSVWAIGGLLMLSLGIIGEYIGKIYLETKKRPKYIIDSIIENDRDE